MHMRSIYIRNILSAVACMLLLGSGTAHLSRGQYQEPARSAGIDIWWPQEQAALSGVQWFKAQVPGGDVADYHLFWQVDGGAWNWMHEDYTDWPHREVGVDVSGWGWSQTGTYAVQFIATNRAGQTIAAKTVTVRVRNGQLTDAAGVAGRPSFAAASAVRTSLYAAPQPGLQDRARQVGEADAKRLSYVAAQPIARWFGNWNGDVRADVAAYTAEAKAAGAEPVLVAYNIPERDCGGWSAGGSGAYGEWIRAFAAGIGEGSALVVLEPDALASMECLAADQKENRLQHVRDAVNVLSRLPSVQVYVDAGHVGWVSPVDMASRLRAAGIEHAAGFALNVSNFESTKANIAYGEQVSQLLGGAHFVIDTSRNGAGSVGAWCNPAGAALGQSPTRFTDNALVDAYLWVKNPTESDGGCNGGPAAGAYYERAVLDLARNAGI